MFFLLPFLHLVTSQCMKAISHIIIRKAFAIIHGNKKMMMYLSMYI